MADKPLCKIEGCCKPAKNRGWCAMHYQRWVRHGDPLYTPDKTSPGEAIEWLKSYVGHSDKDGCVIWPFGTYRGGYGHMRTDGKYMGAHKVMCLMAHGEPEGERTHVAHSCGNASCINPNHLRWATKAENEADKVDHGTSNRGSRHGMARLTEADVREIRALKGKMLQKQIATRFGIGKSTVSLIHSRKLWSWLD